MVIYDLCLRNFAFFCIAINSPDGCYSERHRKANREQFHRVPSEELTIDEMIYDQHDTAAPEHQFKGLEITTDEGVGLFGANTIDCRYYRLR